MKQTHTSRIIVDIHRLDENIASLRRLIGPSVGICGVVKADAYGLGAVPISSRLHRLGVDMLAVFTTEEARELVSAGIAADILLLMPIRQMPRHDALYRALISGRLHAVVHDAAHLDQLIRIAESYGCVWPLHVEIDTGMSRGGMTTEEATVVINRIIHHRRLRLAGIMTHFACADSDEIATELQFRSFAEIISQFDDDLLKSTKIHMANTSACMNFGKRFHFDMVRLGLAWVGYGANGNSDCNLDSRVSDDCANNHAISNNQLQPIVRWVSSIVHTKWIEPGMPVGYGWTWKAERKTRLGLVPVGYADGYPAALSNRSVVRIRKSSEDNGWWIVPVVGQVSMDQLMIDLTEVPLCDTNIGTEVELLSQDNEAPNNLLALARLAGVVPYAILCGLSSRIPRRFVDHHSHESVGAELESVVDYSFCMADRGGYSRVIPTIRISR